MQPNLVNVFRRKSVYSFNYIYAYESISLNRPTISETIYVVARKNLQQLYTKLTLERVTTHLFLVGLLH